MSTAFALVDMTTQDRSTAGQYLAHIFKYDRPDPTLVLGYELKPMRSKDYRNMITDMSCGAEHKIFLS
jgi:hypothetical protein